MGNAHAFGLKGIASKHTRQKRYCNATTKYLPNINATLGSARQSLSANAMESVKIMR
jgi:hypothetical protein